MCMRARTHRPMCLQHVQQMCTHVASSKPRETRQGSRGAAHEGAPLAPVVPLTPLDTPVPVALLGVYPVAPVAPVPLQQGQLNVTLVSGAHRYPKWTL